jgi:hypothetical protein
MMLEAVVVTLVAGLLLYGAFLWLMQSQDRRPTRRGEWRVTHYEASGVTRVVLQKLTPGGTHLVDEHVVATLRTDDADFDDKFLAAMATARERRALFQAEEE